MLYFKIEGFNFEDDPLDDLDALIGKSSLKKQTESAAKKPPIATSSSVGSNLNKIAKTSLSHEDFDELGLFGLLIFCYYYI